MKAATINQAEKMTPKNGMVEIINWTKQSFKRIAPFWPLKNLIAVNPLQGLEDMPIETALEIGAAYFQQPELPKSIAAINRETIKWLQVYCDEGQATITMPLRKRGLYTAWRQLAIYDVNLHRNNKQAQQWLQALPETAEQTIAACLLRLNLEKAEKEQFLTLMLTTLPGWAAYIKYRTEWAGLDINHPHPITQEDYLALRLTITSLLWPEAKALLKWHSGCLANSKSIKSPLEQIQKCEASYHQLLLQKLAAQQLKPPHIPEAQLVFCIDVRSESFRRALEATGDYQTFGFAGFFGVPVEMVDTVTNESYASCPVLLSPKHKIKEPSCNANGKLVRSRRQSHRFLSELKRLYQSVKYTFTTPFALIEALGIASGIWMGLRSFFPKLASSCKTVITQTPRKLDNVQLSLDSITLSEQCAYAESALKMMGFTHHFARLVILCGHGSTTQNNAYASALDCGACGGRHGASNAIILATILNRLQR